MARSGTLFIYTSPGIYTHCWKHNGLNKSTNKRLFDPKNVVKLSIVSICEDVEVVMELCGARRRHSVRPRWWRVGFAIRIAIIFVII
jgi:hypothetical protein